MDKTEAEQVARRIRRTGYGTANHVQVRSQVDGSYTVVLYDRNFGVETWSFSSEAGWREFASLADQNP